MVLNKITLAVNEMDRMVHFYNETFLCDLQAVPETPFFAGQFLGASLLLCPNFIAEVDARQNRFQFDIIVEDLDGVASRAVAAGGTMIADRSETPTATAWGVRDPDGNSLVLIETRS